MTPKVALIHRGQLCYVLPRILHLLAKSERWTNGRAIIDDIISFLYSGQMILWVAYDEETQTIIGYTITEEKEYPRKKMLVVQYCASEKNKKILVEEQMAATLDRYARDAGCEGIEFWGRPGWGPTAEKFGYSVQTVVYEKHFYKDSGE